MPGYTTSCIMYQDYETKIKELNKTFQTIHSNLSPSLTLTMIRELKRGAIEIWCNLCSINKGKYMMEISTLALCFVYFENLIYQKYVTHSNCKLVMCVCIILALKFNELCEKDDLESDELDRKYGIDKDDETLRIPKEKKFTREVLQHILDEIYDVFNIDSKYIFKIEFEVFAQLHFGLHLLKEEFEPYVSHLLELPSCIYYYFIVKELRIEYNYLEEDLIDN